jgi:hypothetical protein
VNRVVELLAEFHSKIQAIGNILLCTLHGCRDGSHPVLFIVVAKCETVEFDPEFPDSIDLIFF